MLKTLAKGAALAVLLTGLVACDNQDSKKPEVPAPAPKPVVTQPVTPAPAPPVEEPKPVPGLNVSLQKGQITFELPLGFSDQTKLSGIINDDKSTIQLFLDSKSRQRTVASEVIPPADMKINTSDAMLKELTQSIITELSDRYQNIKKTKEENFTVGKQKFHRLDTEQTVNGQKLVSTIVLTVFNKRVVTLQLLTPAKTPDLHHALVQRIIDTLTINQ
ncbi:DcrB-related protein [Serratia fonticola]|uniref:DcrB-related protein n=1 Tax=Serratia fonticola TaxID=47917 RepID=A0AAW3WLP6_SERFO|nr:DcrB-related protein [Serratia fonticola]MBC3211894.1 DcrB-related protein [Serratia fonticola]NYA13455.1 DcrB-related protein [Serratia fonticola]NYA33265.1 DcrB-related protein [Serratia fonticola]